MTETTPKYRTRKPKAEAKPEAKPEPKATGPIWFETREKEPTQFPVAGIAPIRNFSSGRLEYEVQPDDLERFVQNHFVITGRVVRKA